MRQEEVDYMDYPKEWDDLPKKERKNKIKKLQSQKEQEKKNRTKKIRNTIITILLIGALVYGIKVAMTKPPEQIALEQEMDQVTLEDRVQEHRIEGTTHVSPGTEVEYQTNPPTSGNHYATPTDWGVYDDEVSDEATVHSLEHGGIWITYKDVDEETIETLEEIGKQNPGSVVVSPRADNDANIAVVSWGKSMKLEEADKALIQKFINTYKNQSPEPLAQ